jgi:hypothetical protein
MPIISFRKDVLPIFQSSCATNGTSCHGGDSAMQPMTVGALILGSVDGGAPSMSVVAGLVGVGAAEAATTSFMSTMNLVTAGDPANSFLMHKMDNDQCTLESQCMAYKLAYPKCGSLMPNVLDPMKMTAVQLPVAQRDIVRAWIKQGAKDN